MKGLLGRRSFVRMAPVAVAAVSACRPRSANGSWRIAVVPKGSTHEFWKAVHAGANDAAERLNPTLAPLGKHVELLWKGPLREDDREQQVQVIEGFCAQGIDALVLAPLDANALARPVEEAARLGIPTVVIDSALNFNGTVSFVATDNEAGGALAADCLARQLPEGGNIILLRYQHGSASTEAREKGFLEAVARTPSLHLISADQHAGSSRDTAKRAAENLLNRFGDKVSGVFAPCEPVTMGMMLALADAGLSNKVKLVGFDMTPAFVAALEKKLLAGVVVQSPFDMGRKGVETAVNHLLGKPVAKRIPTAITLVTPDNLRSPDVAAFLPRPSAG